MTSLEVQGSKVLDYQHVIAGYKATISSPRTSEEAKGSARLMIAALEEAEQKSVGAAVEVDKDQDTIHHHRVIGGMKAALKNEHVSEEAKAETRARLDEMGEEHI